MRSLLQRFLGAGRPRVIAVVGLRRKDVEAGVKHAHTSGSGLPVWAWCVEDAAPLCGCARLVAQATASRIRKDLRQVWPALTIVSWTGQPGAWAVKLAPFIVPPFRIVIRNEAEGFFPARPGPVASHVFRRLRDATTNVAGVLALWFSSLDRRLAKHRRNIRGRLEDQGWKVPRHGNDRTAYIIGLFGSGRWYLNGLIVNHLGKRGMYLRDSIRLRPGPTSMIYSGHATLKYISRFQAVPEETARIVEAVRTGIADSIFIYRHPLDSLLTNWLWWRTFLRKKRQIWGITQIYSGTEDLCADLDAHFDDFRAFAEGDPAWFAPTPGPRFLSFAEFVEETELHMQCATLSLRLEDFMIDPAKEFRRMAQAMSVEVRNSHTPIDPPRTTAYRWRALRERSAAFRSFVADLDAETMRRIARIGY